MDFIRSWLQRHFSDPQVVGLAVVLAVGFAVVIVMGNMLAPVIASVIIAYLLEGLVGLLERHHSPRLVAVVLVFLAFMAFLLSVLFGLLPLLSRQVTQLAQQLPQLVAQGQEFLLSLPARYPAMFSEEQVREIIPAFDARVITFAQQVLVPRSFASVVTFLTVLVYLILMPLMVFFFLKDKRRILAWLENFWPRKRTLLIQVWKDVDLQIGNYVRGKFIEILIVWTVTYVTFMLLGLQFAMLLSVLVGLSVVIPYIGAVVVTIPVVAVAFFQWGFSSEFAWVVGAYAIIQALDGNVLVPLVFSEVVNLHPVAVIVAVLVFGGLWGFWGVFFAIPLATLVQAVLTAWPNFPDDSEPVEVIPAPGGTLTTHRDDGHGAHKESKRA